MPSTLSRKLSAYVDLTSEEISALEKISARSQRVEARTDIIREGDIPADVLLVQSGLACRYKLLDDGRRQIVAFLIPGDMSDMNGLVLGRMDHTIAAVSTVQLARLSPEQMLDLLHHQGIARALSLATLVDQAVLREWVTNLGQRSAEHRLAHLICELFVRMKTVGLTDELEYELPVTQAELGDTLGLSTVHLNRSLQSLKAADLVTFKGRRIVITDIARLEKFSGFHDDYLHLQAGDPQGLAA